VDFWTERHGQLKKADVRFADVDGQLGYVDEQRRFRLLKDPASRLLDGDSRSSERREARNLVAHANDDGATFGV